MKPRVLQSGLQNAPVTETNFKYCDPVCRSGLALKVDTEYPAPPSTPSSLPFSTPPRSDGPPDQAAASWTLAQRSGLLPDIYIYIVTLLPAPAARRQCSPNQTPPPCEPPHSVSLSRHILLLHHSCFIFVPPPWLLFVAAAFSPPLLPSNLRPPSLRLSLPLCRLTACLPS